MMDWSGWTARQKAVLVLMHDSSKVLLIHKLRGLGQGKVNAPGGKLEPGETWLQAAVRETEEETGMTPVLPVASARIWYQFVDGYSLDVTVFTASAWTGELRSCDEAEPFWISTSDIPWATMWADDGLWVPHLLKGRALEARFVFDGDKMNEARVWLIDGSSLANNG